jgi:class 3 adenylate cyclase/predicted ATPase
MFCDLVGSTALSARLDPEDMREIIGAYHRCSAEQITKSGGFVAKYMGDGVLAYFGYPQAHEDDAERAVQAALALIEAVPKLRAQRDAALQVRLGVATGLVVVGDLVGEGIAQEHGVVGDTPNLAARLQALAEPGQVVISQATRRLAGGLFDYGDLGRVVLKGLSDPVQAWRVLGRSGVESRFEARQGASLTPLVGREGELELMLRCWRRAKAGDGSVALISGEPGIGKSRIVQALLERLGAEPYTRLRQFCSPHHQDTALHPTIMQLERAAGFRRDDTDEQRLDKLEAVLVQATSDLREAVPMLAGLLSLPADARHPALDLTPQKRKERTLRALVAQVEGLAGRQPVLMVVEDAHWIDPTSLELLDLIVDRTPNLPLLLIITFRPEFTPPWVGRPQVTLLSLGRLLEQQRTEMLARLTGGKSLPKEIADQIVERTDGIPLFMEELTKTVVESGELVDAGDHYTVTRSLSPLAIPTTLHASLLARLDRLAPVREVAQIGAVIGRNFSHELISAVASMPQLQLDDALAQLEHAELIFRRGIPPEAEYTFKHALVQDAAYSTLLRTRRRQLHRRVVAALEGQFPEITAGEPARLAQHCAEAALGEKAIGYWLKAGQQALVRSAMTEAARQLSKGLDLVLTLPDSTWRQQQELDLQIALGQALLATQGYAAPQVGETYARARQLCEQLNRPAQFVAVLYGQFLYHLCRRNDLALARQIAEEICRLGEAGSDAAVQSLGTFERSSVDQWRGDFGTALDGFVQVFEQYAPAHRTLFATLTAEDQRVAALIHMSALLSYLGFPDKARVRDAEALAEADRLGHTFSRVFALGLFFCNWTVQPVDETLRRAEKVVALSMEHGFPMFQLLAMMVRGWCLAMLGRPEEGIAQLQQGVAVWRSSGAEIGVPFMLTLLADAYRRAGRPEEGLKQLIEAEHSMEARNERVYEAEMHRVRGELLVSVREPGGAEKSFSEAIGVAQRQGAKLFELRAATSLARLWHGQGKDNEARDLLGPINGWFTEGLDHADVKDAKALLAELS